MQFICISHPHDNVPPLSNPLPGLKERGGQEVRSEERMELSGMEESRKLPRPGQHKWDTVEPQEGEKERLEVRSWCFCTSNSCQGWLFCRASFRLQSQDTGAEAGILTRHGAGLGELSIATALSCRASVQWKVCSAQGAKHGKESKQGREKGENETEEHFGCCFLAS